MSTFVDGLFFDVVFVGFYQALFAVVVALTVLPIAALWLRINYGLLVRRFMIFNVFFLCWSAGGNALWLYLTSNRLAVADDAPVWAAFFPFGRYVLDHAAGWREGWHLLGGTTITQLRWIWAATAMPVWLLTILSLFIYVRARAARTATISN
jgi:hypothetical protein